MTEVSALAQYGPDAAKLFGSMITPAAIMGGSMVPLGFGATVPYNGSPEEGKVTMFLRRLYPFLALVTLSSQFLAVVWATVAVNQLTETKVPLSESVWHLLTNEYALEWAAVNTHFVVGMLGFMSTLATKLYFLGNKGIVGPPLAAFAGSVTMFMVSIINRGVASGGGQAASSGDILRFGGSVLALFRQYFCLLLKRACSRSTFGPLELIAVTTMFGSIVATIRNILISIEKDCADKTKQA